ncbi:hypothetical protein LXL04_023814 [Taraxacum kok-saghyz]
MGLTESPFQIQNNLLAVPIQRIREEKREMREQIPISPQLASNYEQIPISPQLASNYGRNFFAPSEEYQATISTISKFKIPVSIRIASQLYGYETAKNQSARSKRTSYFQIHMDGIPTMTQRSQSDHHRCLLPYAGLEKQQQMAFSESCRCLGLLGKPAAVADQKMVAGAQDGLDNSSVSGCGAAAGSAKS